MNQVRATFLFLLILHILCLFAFDKNADEGTVLLFSGIFSLLSYGYLINDEIKRITRLATPILTYLIAGMLRHGIGVMWVGATILHGTELNVLWHGPVPVFGWLVLGQIVLLVGDLCFLGTYFYLDKSDRINKSTMLQSIYNKGNRTLYVASAMIALGFCLRLISILAGSNRLGFIPTMLSMVLPCAGVFLLLVQAEREIGTRRFRLFAAIAILVIVDVGLGLRSYMKSAIIIPLLPLLIHAVAKLRSSSDAMAKRTNTRRFFFVAITVSFLVIVLFPANQIRRSRGTTGFADRSMITDIQEAMSAALPGTPEFARLHKFPDSGLWQFGARHATVKGAAWAYTYVHFARNVGWEFIYDSAISLVPRIIWKNKPQHSPGRKISVMMGMARSFEEVQSATDAGAMAGGLFLGFGWIGVVVGMAVNGAVFHYVSSLVLPRMESNPGAAAAGMLLYIQTLTFFESSSGGNVDLYGVLLIIFLPTALIWNDLHRKF